MPEANVWWAPLAALREHHHALLDAIEGQRRASYHRDEDRDRFTLGAVLLRVIAAGELGVAPAQLRIDRHCPRCAIEHGRPTLPDHDLHVSVSHAGDWVVVATTTAGPVGVDVEEITALEYEALVPRVMTAGEQPSAGATREGFFQVWSRKESVLKATGDGLRTPMTAVVLGAGPAVLAYRDEVAPPAAVRDLRAPDGYVGAVTVWTSADLVVTERDATPLLSVGFPEPA